MSTTTDKGRKAEQATTAQHELLSFAVSNSRIIFYVAAAHGDHAVHFISANVEALTGHPPRAFTDDPGFAHRRLHPGDQAVFDRAVELVKEAGVASREYRLRAESGEYLWFRDELKLADDGRTFVGSMVNISERATPESDWAWINQLIQDAIESLPSGFALYDADDRVILCNSAFARIYNRDRASMLRTTRKDNVRDICRRLRRFGGQVVASTEADADWMLARLNDVNKGPVELELDDGSWMLASHSPTTDGGTVVVRTDITRQKTAEHALRESEEYFRRIVENHPLPVVLFDVETGRLLYESPAVGRLLRRSAADDGPYSTPNYFPDAEQRKRFMRTLRQEGAVHGFEIKGRLHDGTTGWLSITARLISYRERDTVIANLVDLTARKSAEEALAASELRYRTLFENAPVCIHEIDRDGRISAMNPRGLQIAGAPRIGPVVGRRYMDLIHPEDRPLVAERLDAAMAGERVEMEFRGFGDKGHYFSTKIPLRDDSGEVSRLIGVVIDITERKRQELALREAGETLEDAIESLPDGFALWDADDRLILCNTRFKEYNRLSADVLEPGVLWRDFMCTAARRGQYPEIGADIDDWVAQLRRELNEEGRTREFRDAEGRWYRTIARRTRQDGLVGVRVDITQYKQLENALRDSEALVREVLEACPVPILMTRVDGRILYESPAGRQLFGRRLSEQPSYSLGAWGSLSDRDAYLARLRETGEVDEYEALLRRPDGSLFTGAISARLIRFKGEDVIVSSTRDLTEQRAVEQEMQRQREALYQSEKLSAMGQLLASVAHELNNPLSVVVGQALLLQETVSDPAIVSRAEKIGKAADRCARIVKTFLAMARQHPTEMETVALNDVVSSALEVAGHALRSNDIDVVMELDSDAPPVWGDPDQLNQVLTNLLVNAQQALEVQAGPRRVKIRTFYDAGAKQLVLELSDNGPGMTAAVRSRIFEPFFTTKDKGSGTGIGLAVSHRILSTHGGTISCESTPGRGTTFHVRLPATPPAGDAVGRLPGSPATPAGLQVLVVDDEPDVADVIAELLRSDGHRVVVASSGETALEQAAASAFDLILSDIRMPGLDGPGLYTRLIETSPMLTDRVAFITGDSLSLKARQFLEASNCPRLEKPVNLTELRSLLARFQPGREVSSH